MITAKLSALFFYIKKNRHLLAIIEIIALFLCLGIMEKFLEYLLVVEDGFTKQLMEDFYNIESNIDNIYLGSSHVHYNIKPQVLDKVTGENNFNLATGLQPMNTSYYLLREANKENKIAHVYLELSCGLTIGDYGKIKTYEQLPNSWRVLDYVKPSINKLQWMLDISEPENYYLSFIPARRYYKELLDGNYIAGQLQNKAEDERTKWKGGYVYKGYRETEVIIDGLYTEKSKSVALEKNSLAEDINNYLMKIINYCKKNQIELTLFTSPITECELHNFINYDNWGNEVRKLAAESGINYFDFNLCRTEYLDLYDEQYWRDNNHLNTWGAEVYSQFIGKVFEEEKNEKGNPYQYFYDNHQQKMQNMEKMIFGLTIDEIRDEERDRYLENLFIEDGEKENYRVFSVTSVDNFDVEEMTEYYFSLTDGEHEYIIQDWSENAVCAVPAKGYGERLNISVRKKNMCIGRNHSISCQVFLDK